MPTKKKLTETLGYATTRHNSMAIVTTPDQFNSPQVQASNPDGEGEQRNGAGLCMPSLAQLPCGRLEQLTDHLEAVLARAVPGSYPFSSLFSSVILLSIILLLVIFFLS